MAFVSTVGGGSSTLGGIQLGLGTPPLGSVRRTYMSVSVGGNTLTNVRSARVRLGFDQAVAEASIVLAAEPGSTPGYNDDVTVALGAGRNNVVRFTGLFKQFDRTLWPRSVTLTARGRLSRAAEFKNRFDTAAETAVRQENGIASVSVTDLVGAATATDEMMVYAALQRVSGLDVRPENIGGTSTDLGGLPSDATAWQIDETALAFVQRIDTASLGYRTFESIAGTIWRAQIAGWPGNVTQAFTFTEGLDISEGRSTRTTLDQKDTVRVDGYNLGIGIPAITFESTPTSEPKTLQFSTPLAGHINTGAGIGFACEDIANYLLSEWDRELVRVTLTTPRDDVIGPGQTHLLTTSSGQPDRLGTAEPLWVQSVEISVDDRGRFRQTITYLGGGVADGFDAPIDWQSQ